MQYRDHPSVTRYLHHCKHDIYQFRMELVISRPRRAIVVGVGAWVTFQSLSDGRGKRFKLKLAVE